jgi:hypothetical protein
MPIKLPRQDTATTVSSLSTSCSNLETSESNVSSAKTRHKKHYRVKNRRNSIEHYDPSTDVKTLKTLKVHYYPEEQLWSIVIVIVAFIINNINHGLQCSFGITLQVVINEFDVSNLNYAGE